MRCPECNTTNEADAAACATCGLILIKLSAGEQKRRSNDHAVEQRRASDRELKRRAEDRAGQKRRAADREVMACQFCGGQIPQNAIRCRHCSEIVNDEFYRQRAQRIRSRVNYASWVAYIFGLGALLVFRPAGLVSIGAGLLLSILYYAIPLEPPPSKENAGKRPSLFRRLGRQLKLERVAVPIPRIRMRLVFVGTPLLAAVVGYSANAVLLQRPMNDVLHENSAFNGMRVSAHYEYYVVPGVVVYDLRDLSFRQTPIDVHTALLEFAKKMRLKDYKRVELSYRGTTKYTIDGASFRRLGEEYAKRNFEFVLYSFPRLFQPVGDDSTAQSGSDRDALLQFHRHWYGQDQLTKSVANGL